MHIYGKIDTAKNLGPRMRTNYTHSQKYTSEVRGEGEREVRW